MSTGIDVCKQNLMFFQKKIWRLRKGERKGGMGKPDSQRQGGSKDIASPAIHGLELILAAIYQGGFRRLVIDCDDDEVCGPEERLCGLEDQVG